MQWIRNMLRGKTLSPSADWCTSSRTCEALPLLDYLHCLHRAMLSQKTSTLCGQKVVTAEHRMHVRCRYDVEGYTTVAGTPVLNSEPPPHLLLHPSQCSQTAYVSGLLHTTCTSPCKELSVTQCFW